MDIEVQKNKNSLDSIAVWSITPNGRLLGQKIKDALDTSIFFVSTKIWGKDQPEKNTFIFEKLSSEIHFQFNKFSGHVFIFSTGIVIRIVAPLLNSKTIDPGVVVIDDNGQHVISLISGHLGGANTLAKKIAAIINATPVITTATDTNLLPSIDMIAKEQCVVIETPQNIKRINMAFLMGEPVNLYDPFGVIKNSLPQTFLMDVTQKDQDSEKVFCSYKMKTVSRETLILRPPVLCVGVGCNRGTGCQEIIQFLFSVFEKEGLSVDSIYRFATTILKTNEKGLLALSEEMKIQMDFYSSEELNSVKTIKTPSKMVEKHLGVKSVCEAAAILSSGNGKLIVPKKKNKDVTIAVAIKK